VPNRSVAKKLRSTADSWATSVAGCNLRTARPFGM
jgi:hypothetical protein